MARLQLIQRPLVYFAHPVAPGDPPRAASVGENMVRAYAWFRAMVLRGEEMGIDVVAPWMCDVLSFDDAIPAERAMGFRRNERFILRCDGIWTCGPLISSGMKTEANWMIEQGKQAYDWTHLGLTLPPDPIPDGLVLMTL